MAKQTKKQSRKELLKEEDAFIEAANKSVDWATENRGLVVGGLLAMFVIIAAALGASTMLHAKAADTSMALAEALEVYNAELVSEGEAKPDGDPPTFATEKARAEASLEAFAPLRSMDGIGAMASFYHADLQEQLNNDEAARTEFDALLAAIPASDPVYFLAVERKAFAQERSGDIDGALETWAKLAGGNAFYADRAAFNRARLLEKQGDTEQARELYEAFLDSYPESTLAEDVRIRSAALAEGSASAKEDQAPAPAQKAEAPTEGDDIVALENEGGDEATP